MKLETYKAIPEAAGSDRSQPTVARFTLEEPPFADKTFCVKLHVCGNPCCSCEIVGLECYVDGDSRETIRFDVDLLNCWLDKKNYSHPDADALGKAFCREAQAADWRWLRGAFVSAKRKEMETMDLDRLEVDFPSHIKAGTGTMVGYAEIFPWTEMFPFSREEEQWFVDDQYCVRPGCPCTSAALSFLCVPDISRSKKARCRTVLWYDYSARHLEVEERRRGSPDPNTLMENLMAAHPDVASTLSSRHEQLKQIGRRYWPAQEEFEGSVPVSVSNESLPSIPPLTKRSSVKIGRNDPCPCGSGKKFKKCCGA